LYPLTVPLHGALPLVRRVDREAVLANMGIPSYEPILIDTDCGIDDAVAIMMALASLR
jgi:hypothetical protein